MSVEIFVEVVNIGDFKKAKVSQSLHQLFQKKIVFLIKTIMKFDVTAYFYVIHISYTDSRYLSWKVCSSHAQGYCYQRGAIEESTHTSKHSVSDVLIVC